MNLQEKMKVVDLTPSEITEKIASKIDVDWMIHYVFSDKIVDELDIHTHGLNKRLGYEIETNLYFEEKMAKSLLNSIAVLLCANNLKDIKEDTLYVGLVSTPIYFKKIQSDECDLYRVIFPDENGFYPEDEGCNERYKIQERKYNGLKDN